MLTLGRKKLVFCGNFRFFPNLRMSHSSLNRAQVEHLVRQSLSRMGATSGPAPKQGPNPLVVNISARHCHLSQESVEVLFGKGHQLSPMKDLYMEGQYAAQESVTMIGPRSRVISNLRILGPCRDFDQVELAYTDAVSLGYKIPIRNSGDIEGTPGCMLMGPAGFLEMDKGVIRAAPHVHMAPADAAYYGVENKSYMKLRVGGELATTFDRIFVRVDPSFKLEVHIDTDEGNACGFSKDTPCELIK